MTKNKKRKIIWQASPSSLLLTQRVLFITLFGSLSALSFFADKGIELFSYNLVLAQQFLLKFSFSTIAFSSITSLLALEALVAYIKITFENYQLDDTSLHFKTGVLNRNIDETKLFRVVDVGVEMPLFLRIFGRGHVIVYSNDPSLESSGIISSIQTPDGRKGVYLAATKNPIAVKNTIQNHVDISRAKQGTRGTEML